MVCQSKLLSYTFQPFPYFYHKNSLSLLLEELSSLSFKPSLLEVFYVNGLVYVFLYFFPCLLKVYKYVYIYEVHLSVLFYRYGMSYLILTVFSTLHFKTCLLASTY